MGLDGFRERDIWHETDCCSKEGATRIKARIENYWLERGAAVQVDLHQVGFHPAMRSGRFDVRSDLVNGFPKKVA